MALVRQTCHSIGAFAFAILILFTFVVILPTDHISLLNNKNPLTWKQYSSGKQTKCLSVLSSMLKGKWLQKKMTVDETKENELLLLTARNQHKLPATLDRTDQKCGNVTFDNLSSKFHHLLWFRALCNPKGANPCCKNGRFTAASEEQCRCKECYDLRQQIQAEYSRWIPSDSKCQPKEFSHMEACKLLNGSTLFFIGDSFVRHIYLALTYKLKNYFEQGGTPFYLILYRV